ncbi:50S ribosomal protein L18 [Candidatus Woesearchaeota archaeon]|nr:50S ribosomal protein L18 [Candidatus Woesearchaeota archaeon]|tara:strand:+ start:18760 stop:19263 length:504 start_codon:yes stop_codon:yes gene_type:complete
MKKITSIQFKRKRKSVTNYRNRLKLILSGKDRLVIRKTSKHIIVQLAKFDEKGDVIITSASSNNLKKYGWQSGLKNIPAAYLTGLLAGKQAIEKNVKEAVLDAGLSKPVSNGRIYTALKGVIDAGVKIPAATDIFPPEDRISGKHISEKIPGLFKSTKEKIMSAKND